MFENLTVTDVIEVFTVFSPKGRAEKRENRTTFGLTFCIDGQITYTHKGQKVVSDQSHAVILPQGQSYTLRGDKTGSFPVINFKCQSPLCDTPVAIPIEDNSSYLRNYEKLRSLLLFDGNRFEALSVFYHILYRLSTQNLPCRTVLPAIKHIKSAYKDPDLTVSELASLCNISEAYFRRVFAKNYGMSPKEFLIDIRINKAKQLLAEGALKINTVAAECGFSNQYHFCRTFKEKTGQTPTEYMKLNRIYKI